MSDAQLITALLDLANTERTAGAEMFFKKPDRWYVAPHWRCRNDHVSTMYIKSEELGAAVCQACGAYVYLTFPEDIDGPLESPLRAATARRVALICKGIYGSHNDPNRCTCADKETGRYADTPHTHYTEWPHSCARCQCAAYTPAQR